MWMTTRWRCLSTGTLCRHLVAGNEHYAFSRVRRVRESTQVLLGSACAHSLCASEADPVARGEDSDSGVHFPKPSLPAVNRGSINPPIAGNPKQWAAQPGLRSPIWRLQGAEGSGRLRLCSNQPARLPVAPVTRPRVPVPTGQLCVLSQGAGLGHRVPSCPGRT